MVIVQERRNRSATCTSRSSPSASAHASSRSTCGLSAGVPQEYPVASSAPRVSPTRAPSSNARAAAAS